ncbi:MAG: isoleucine-tRNA ligase [Bacteroidota bacterium]|jgi:isoleucyl-tRNA synthetase
MEKNVLLPKTSFTSKSEWKEREPKFLKFWKDENVFSTRNEKNNDGEFLLHDGPPYANGKLHLGHFLNKLLKDSFMKFNLMQGKKVNMRLGFDCHGLPTELEVLKLNPELSNDDTLLRKKYFSFSKNQMEKQLKQMEKWGLTCDWNPYYTTEKNYETKELEMLYFFLNKNLLYQEKRPVWYSPTSKSVLAESELEYKDVVDNTLYVKFPSEDFNFLAWTTQPWTLLGNKGLAVNPEMLYKKVLFNNELYVVEKEMNFDGDVVSEFLGSELVGKQYTNLFDNTSYTVVAADYVKSGSGTGVVHLCPMHGEDDFEALKVSYDNLVDSDGLLSNGVYWEDSFEMMKTLSLENNSYFKEEKYSHEYPFDWRSKRKVLMLLENQFFLDLKPMKRKVKATLENVVFSDEKSKKRLVNTVLSRERWCLSRQRKWGFPLALFLQEGKPFVNKESQEYLLELFKEKGSLVWFESSVEDLLPENLKHLKDTLVKYEFTMDVWFDSSVSWYSVMNGVSDMYLEGSDQSRGWFQGSLLTCLGKEKKSPFKQLFTHGFVLDADGKKMSKSLGNVVEVEELMKDWNSDVLRLWVYSSDVKSDVRWSKEKMEKCGEAYFKLRNTLKFMLGNLYGYNGEEFEKNEKDALGLSLSDELLNSCKSEMENMNLRGVYENLMNFVREYSSSYLDLELKSDLYEAEVTDEKRLRKQEVLYKGFLNMVKVLSYVTPYLAEDAYSNLSDNLRKEKSVYYL